MEIGNLSTFHFFRKRIVGQGNIQKVYDFLEFDRSLLNFFLQDNTVKVLNKNYKTAQGENEREKSRCFFRRKKASTDQRFRPLPRASTYVVLKEYNLVCEVPFLTLVGLICIRSTLSFEVENYTKKIHEGLKCCEELHRRIQPELELHLLF